MDPKDKTRLRERYRGFESIPVPVVVRIGRVTLSFDELSNLAQGTVLRLDVPVGAPFELLTGEARLARVEPIASEGNDGISLKLVSASTQGGSDDATG
jgi:flagellar motor switch/type III secretory pathway protein FliN